MDIRLPPVLQQGLVETVLQGLIGKVGLSQEPGIDGVLVEEFLAYMGIVPHGDKLLLGKLVGLALGKARVLCQVLHIERFFVVANSPLISVSSVTTSC